MEGEASLASLPPPQQQPQHRSLDVAWDVVDEDQAVPCLDEVGPDGEACQRRRDEDQESG